MDRGVTLDNVGFSDKIPLRAKRAGGKVYLGYVFSEISRILLHSFFDIFLASFHWYLLLICRGRTIFAVLHITFAGAKFV